MAKRKGTNLPVNGSPAGGFEGCITLGPFTVDIETARVFRDGRELHLRPRVFRVLEFLIHNPGRLVDFDELIHAVWAGVTVSKHCVAVTVGQLKRELGKYGSWITIRRGYGYCLEIPKTENLIRVGQHFRNQLTRSGLVNALRCFRQVAKTTNPDPRLWEALTGLYVEMGLLSAWLPRDVRRAFLRTYRRAVALGGVTPGLQLNRAVSLFIFERRFAEAESELLQIRRSQPGLPEVRVHLATVYFMLGRTDEAFAELWHAEKADALSPLLALVKSRMLLCRREVDAAVIQAKKAVALYPSAPFAHLNYADVLEFGGAAERALAEYHIARTIAPDVPWIRAAEARCLARYGRTSEALHILARLQKNREIEYVDAYHLALLLEALGRRDEAFRELERAHVEESVMLAWLDLDTNADTLRSDPRFGELRDRIFSKGFRVEPSNSNSGLAASSLRF